MSANRPIRIAQITDPHLFADERAELLGLNTRDSFLQVIDALADEAGSLDLVVATGDIAQDASMRAYQAFVDAIARLGVPFRWVPGNHDDRQLMQSLPCSQNAFAGHSVLNGWQVVMLDTSVPGKVHGELAVSELERLQDRLSVAESDPQVRHTLVCMHHNPLPGTAGWMLDIGLHNADDFNRLLDNYGSVRAVVYGHIHQELDLINNGQRYICTPSTCIQFKAGVHDFTLDLLPPAYRLLDLHDDGQVQTTLRRLENYTVNVDQGADGY
ncbi:3',5'-cyclic-AMP phosphodiesterase [Pseudohongiella spirulinae]|uniref:3',5'-cyclic adenosine monophosphate phosphodiesterase CpdA n=1 Tax=Pseudohongiella spirulinae TaxID=1249552 RepID=A0A0S2K9N8_9GAMM|nr:3',5'-cyclic-AMP phosphodiesterase [Pseudohongiella spirulinae]ALO45062.1 3',5'-cyclic adenosine monophosphate phosphodiesterase CpdA [Pseudohongiella spirulinae]